MFNSRRSSNELLKLYISLERHLRYDEFDGALSDIDLILDIKGDEVEAYKCKVYCLIQLKMFDRALGLIDSRNFANDEDMGLGRGFVFYQMKNYALAWNAVKDLTFTSATLQHLKAQILYQLEDPNAVTLYEGLLHNDINASKELMINFLAASSFCTGYDRSILGQEKYIKCVEDSYDYYYNLSFLHMNDYMWDRALESLKMAEEKYFLVNPRDGQSSELSLIRTQMAYVYQKLARYDKAQEIYNSISLDAIDLTTEILFTNNFSLLKNFGEPAMFTKLFHLANENGIRLNLKQKCEIYANRAFNLIQSGDNDGALDMARMIRSLDAKSPLSSIIEASTMNEDLNSALRFLRMCPHSESIQVRLTIAHIYLNLERMNECIRTLESIKELKYKPAMIATLLYLYRRTGNAADVQKMLEKYVDSVKKHENPELYVELHFRISQLKSDRNSWETVVNEIMGLDQLVIRENLRIRCKLVRALVQMDPESARFYKLPELPTSDIGIDLDELENADLAYATWVDQNTSVQWAVQNGLGNAGLEYATLTGQKVADLALQAVQKKKRKRKNKPPKNYVENYVPNPERWISKKHEKFPKGAGFGHQGSMNVSRSSENVGVPNKSDNVAKKLHRGTVIPRKNKRRR